MNFIGRKIVIRVTAFVTFDTGKGRQSFFDKGVTEEIVEA